ncbi:MAG: LysM peptidoglycan-binding domain-containing protein [Candidatus Eisenbacteria bacterium]
MGIFSRSKPKQDKSRPDFTNVTTGSSSTAQDPHHASPEYGVHKVQQGDTLSKIAKKHYGDAEEWPRIFAANEDVVKDPDLIYPGQILKIPAA